MRHQSYSPALRCRGHLKWIILTALVVVNLATLSWGQASSGDERVVVGGSDQNLATESMPIASSIALSLVVGAGLLIAGRARARRRLFNDRAPVADFEMAYRLQHEPRIRVDRTPLIRDGSMRLRRTASRLGCDQ